MKKVSVIEKTNRFKGNLKVDGDLEVYGVTEGDIEVSGCLTVEGIAKGNLKAKCAKIKGSIEGKINCLDYIEVAKGNIQGKIKAPKIIISEFAKYRSLEETIEL